MIRVVLLGEYRADRLVPPLREAGYEVVVLGFVELAAFLGPDIVCGELPSELSDHDLLSLLRDYGADIAIPNMNSPGQEQMLPLYARVGPRWRATGREMTVHSEEFAELATDKVAFHRTAEHRGWPVPRGVVCDDPQSFHAAADGIGLPVIVKEARSESHAGRHFVRDLESVDRISREASYPVLVQQVVSGEEYGVEFLSGPTGTLAWPVASLGRLDSDCAPGKRVRVMPAGLPDRARKSLAAVVQDIADTYRPAGPWQMDFAVSDTDDLQVIELNGRFGGLSNMSWSSTGLDPHPAQVEAVRGQPPAQPRPARIALELPVRNQAVLPPVPAGIEAKSFVGNPANRVPYTTGYYRAVLGVPALHERTARDWLLSLPPGLLLIDTDEAITQLACGARSLRQYDEPWPQTRR